MWLSSACRSACRRGSAARSARLLARGGSRRRVALRNIELCFPEQRAASARALAREHFQLARPQPPRARPALVRVAGALRRLIRVEGDVHWPSAASGR